MIQFADATRTSHCRFRIKIKPKASPRPLNFLSKDSSSNVEARRGGCCILDLPDEVYWLRDGGGLVFVEGLMVHCRLFSLRYTALIIHSGMAKFAMSSAREG